MRTHTEGDFHYLIYVRTLVRLYNNEIYVGFSLCRVVLTIQTPKDEVQALVEPDLAAILNSGKIFLLEYM